MHLRDRQRVPSSIQIETQHHYPLIPNPGSAVLGLFRNPMPALNPCSGPFALFDGAGLSPLPPSFNSSSIPRAVTGTFNESLLPDLDPVKPPRAAHTAICSFCPMRMGWPMTTPWNLVDSTTRRLAAGCNFG